MNKRARVAAERVRRTLKALNRLDDVVDLQQPLEGFVEEQLLDRADLLGIGHLLDICEKDSNVALVSHLDEIYSRSNSSLTTLPLWITLYGQLFR